MKLLDPNEIKQDRNQTTEQAKQRTQMLAVEEGRLARLINSAREQANREIEAINKDLSEYKKQIEYAKSQLTQTVNKLRKKRTP